MLNNVEMVRNTGIGVRVQAMLVNETGTDVARIAATVDMEDKNVFGIIINPINAEEDYFQYEDDVEAQTQVLVDELEKLMTPA